ncbi:xanthine dehydrogenase family protein molybdopterin-binding subunit [Georgenia yuyongxinii]|uniref:Xanthine dehydrogenase family protein molybdopterin-binding subunit n=1 Tax=Georgenia yuyongxinii TaxID=2589797 RepID=A0A552WVC7_9MICO|nr:xanthine dehydrogenase family protein molybdopterin-binding subunit [Georgenia yuyongxinii]TRW46676.1 xanthine dehydrogenase family protein molybdopterin-binding subunit [Georgenia yuyongxinii]
MTGPGGGAGVTTGAGAAVSDGPSVGTDARRIGGRERVTGAQEFLADIRLEGMLHVKLVTLDVARARIIAIDTTAARRVPGVVDILTAADLPQPVPRFGPAYQDRPILAEGETKYHGEPVAAVAAETKEAAELAVSLVRVEHEVLPAVTTVAAALAPGAPLVQDPHVRAGGDPLADTNILKERHYGWDRDAVEYSRADLVVENSYTFPMVTHFAIEPHGFIADADADGIRLWSPVQHPYLLQKMMAALFDLPLTQVRVFAPDPGGGFGGKQNPKLEPVVIYLSLRTGRPCRLVLTLEETFQAVRRSSCEVHVRTGFTREGDLVFQDIDANYLIGAYADIAERTMTKSAYLACGPYKVPAARINARAVLSHTTPSTAFRGFGTPQMIWPVEAQMDAAARALGMDGLAIRLRNLAGRGDEIVRGDVPADGDWPTSLRKAAELVGWDEPLPPGRGRGIAVGIKSGATTGLSNATVRLLADGSVIVYAGTSDMGQGARTIYAQLAGDALGAPLEKVTVVMGDTSVVPFDLQTSASRSTVFMGNAITRACEDIHAQLREFAGELHGVGEDDVRIEDGQVLLPDGHHPIAEFVKVGLGRWNGELIGTGRMRKPHMADHPLGGTPAFFEFNCTAFEVEVDTETGEILMHKHVTVSDVGKALNPLQVEMQDEGAAIMGLGHTLMEHIVLDDAGRIRNLGALDYRIPTTKDVPLQLTTAMVENQDGPGPHGAKGISEGALLCTAPALAAAVTDAAGIVIRDLPLTPERVWRAITEAGGPPTR